jgi:hypothetical protein
MLLTFCCGKLRAAWYVLMSALEDDNVQRRGIVCVVYNVASVLWQDTGTAGLAAVGGEFLDLYITMFYQLRDALPLRVSHVHYCHRGEDFQPFGSLLRQLIGNNPACRLLDHNGELTEKMEMDVRGMCRTRFFCQRY